jgi:hypothetical protein
MEAELATEPVRKLQETEKIPYPCRESNTVPWFPVLCLSIVPAALTLFIHNKRDTLILIVVLPCMLTITQLLLQQNAHFYY